MSEGVAYLRRELGSSMVGVEQAVDDILTCMLCCGNMLLESTPGLGKTSLLKNLASLVSLEFKRVQGTCETGFKELVGDGMGGCLFSNIVLVDEVNRIPPNAQSLLLEAMEEKQVTFDGVSHSLPAPFVLVATQNPVDMEGTFELSHAQRDRFLFKSRLTHLSLSEERTVLEKCQEPRQLKPVMDKSGLISAIEDAKATAVPPEVVDFILEVVAQTRSRPESAYGASTRASIGVLNSSKARAYMLGKKVVGKDDVVSVVHKVLGHKVLMSADSVNYGFTPYDFLDDILRVMDMPKG